jgi:ABC-type uncharacterized transport system substrate-binding protein
MKRRAFITLLGGAAAWPLAAQAQQQADRVRRVGVLFAINEGDPEGQRRAAAIRQGLEQRGWSAGGSVQFDYRWAAGDMERLRPHAAELVALKPDVIMAGGTDPLSALRRETSTIPIVFVQAIDPVGAGYVASLARPGGNMTGFTSFNYELAGKWLELLTQVAPAVTRIAVVHEPAAPQVAALLREIEAGAASFGLRFSGLAVRDRNEIERDLETFAREPNGGIILLTSPFTVAHRDLFIALAARHALPSVYPFRFFPARGGLASYGIDTIDLYRRAMSYVDRILRGEKAGDLPVQQPTKLELVINLKTAKALGLEVPMTVLARADEVIE